MTTAAEVRAAQPHRVCRRCDRVITAFWGSDLDKTEWCFGGECESPEVKTPFGIMPNPAFRDLPNEIKKPPVGRGVFLVKAAFGYDVMVDGRLSGLDTSWTDADKLAKRIAAARPPGDGRGWGRCQHAGSEACFDAWEHLPGSDTPA